VRSRRRTHERFINGPCKNQEATLGSFAKHHGFPRSGRTAVLLADHLPLPREGFLALTSSYASPASSWIRDGGRRNASWGQTKRLRASRISAGRGTHQLMEAAINNAGVVYHSDPRLILAYLANCPVGGSLALTSCPRLFHSPSWSNDTHLKVNPEDGRFHGSAMYIAHWQYLRYLWISFRNTHPADAVIKCLTLSKGADI